MFRSVFLRVLSLLAAAVIFVPRIEADEREKPDIRQSVVRVIAMQRPPVLLRPWLKRNPQLAVGSGVVIEGKRILTNAHLVLYSGQIEVQPFNSSRRLTAHVEAIAPDMDLAVLQLENTAFFDARPAVKLADSPPRIDDRVRMYGYPVGGAALRRTDGVIARIEYGDYGCGANGLRVEVNAAINPGNSGGPAIRDGEMAGLVFGASLAGRSIGYLIPAEEVRTFLEDIADGAYDGKPDAWLVYRSLENRALREKLDLSSDTNGVVVMWSHPTDSKEPLQEGDVITAVSDYPINNEGVIRLPERDLRVNFEYLIPKLACDGKVALTVRRQGEQRRVVLPVSTKFNFLIPSLKGDTPSYFVWGPLAFSTVTAELVNTLSPYFGERWSLTCNPLLHRRVDLAAFPGEQLVLATAMFPHATTKGYEDVTGCVVSHLNGERIRNLRHLVQMLARANRKQEKFVEFRFADKFTPPLVFNRREVMRSMENILADNGIRRQVSDDLREVWNAGKP